MNWIYKGKEYTQDDVLKDQYSFVYIITNLLTGKRYLGKKVFVSKRTLPPLKGKKRKRIVYKPSDWVKYWGSCKTLLADIEKFGKENFKREIINIYPNKREVNFAELRYQILYNVLDAVDTNDERLWYNENIELKFYPSKDYGSIRNAEYLRLINSEEVKIMSGTRIPPKDPNDGDKETK